MSSGTILLVEDSPDDELLTLGAFRKNGFDLSIVVVRDGAEALDYLFGAGKYAGRNVSQRPTLILLDLKLPKLDGLQVLERVRAEEHTRHLPVIVFTTSNEQRDVEQAYHLGANSYIRKPVGLDQYVQAIQQVGTYWLSLNERLSE
jgi:two-component system response regulator